MAYRPTNTAIGTSTLRNRAALERAMRKRDFSGRELGRAANTSHQTVAQLRSGARLQVRSDTARRIELALMAKPESIFITNPPDAVAA